nr:zf-BED domain-containing protein [Tanacetum cinerariifolium]
MDVTVEQWLDLMYGDHTKVNINVKEGVVSILLGQSYKKQFDEYMEIKKQWVTRGINTHMEYDPSDVEFVEWLASKFYNHKTMDWYTKNALWIYWPRGNDEVELTDEEFFDPDNENLIDKDEVSKIIRIETDIFDIEMPICKAFDKFNYLLKTLAKMKVIKEGSEKLGLLKINKDSFACSSPLGTIFNELNRWSEADDDLFTYEVEIPELPSISCDKKE